MRVNNQTVGVIIPIYNEEQRISFCIESIQKQSYQNLEILIINDGSTDNSGKICDDFSQNDTRIRVIHQENQGLASVRNRGIKEIKSEYFVFVDSDDYVSENYVWNLVQVINLTGLKMAACQYKKTLSNDEEQKHKLESEQYDIYSHEEMLYRMLFHDQAEFSLCDKIYHKSLFEHVIFPDGELYEDIAVMQELIQFAEKIGVHKYYDYFNYLQPNSIQRSSFNRKKLVLIKHIDAILAYAEKNNNQKLITAAKYRKADILIELMFQIDDKEYIKEKEFLWDELKNLRKDILFIHHPNATKAKVAVMLSYLGRDNLEKCYRWFTQRKNKQINLGANNGYNS